MNRRPAADGRDAVVVALPTELDLASAPAVTETLIFAISTRAAVVVADLAGITFCDCAAIRSLCHATQYAAARGTDLRLVIPAGPGPVRRILDLTGLDDRLHLYLAIASALSAPPAGAATLRPRSRRSTRPAPHASS